MAYLKLNATAPVNQTDRVGAIEISIQAGQTESLSGTRYYAGGLVPALQTTGTDTTPVAGTIYLSEVWIRHNTLITGLSYLIGTVGGTDKAIALLFDSAGVLLANSALAGTTVGTLATFQRLAFTTPFQCPPGVFYIGIQVNGTTCRLRTQAGGDHNVGTVAGQTFGTPVALTPPSTFTVSTGPVSMTY